jgi:hypothetical protein
MMKDTSFLIPRKRKSPIVVNSISEGPLWSVPLSAL